MKKRKMFQKIIALMLSIVCFVMPFSTKAEAVAGQAISIGGEFHNGDDVRSACDFLALCGYNSYYTCNPTYSYVNSAGRLNSGVVYFSAHGSQDGIYLLNDIEVVDQYHAQDSNTVVINNFTLSDVKLYIYDACLTASNGDGSGVNLCTETYLQGANCVIGWTQEIYDSDAFEWQKRFQNQLALGWTVLNAANYANRFTYYENSSIKSWIIYGNSSEVVKRTSSTALSMSSNSVYNIGYTDLSTRSVKNNELESYLKSIDTTFDTENYQIEKTPTNESGSNYVIDYVYKNGDFTTSCGYTFIVENDKVIGMQNNMNVASVNVRNVSLSQTPTITEKDISDAYNLANKKVTDRNDGSVITKQTGEPYYDIESGKYYYLVKTVYQTANEYYGAFVTLYEI